MKKLYRLWYVAWCLVVTACGLYVAAMGYFVFAIKSKGLEF